MGTNYYLVEKRPTMRRAIHVCKRSWGWKTSWQSTDENEWPRWCDEDHSLDESGQYATERGLPHSIHSVEDVRALLRTGEWDLIDEYGEVYPDWRIKIDELEAWDGGKHDDPDFVALDHVDECGDGFHDAKGNVFCRGGFC